VVRLCPAALPLVLSLVGCSGDRAEALRPPPGAATYPVELRRPDRLSGVTTGELDALGRPTQVTCVTCHSMRRPAALPTSGAELDEFHQGLELRHGDLTCGACHVIGDQDQLRKADGTLVPMAEAMVLCAQCHGPQFRDFRHGAHGGMTGHWDRSVGGQVRRHCVECHDPHDPAFRPMQPAPPPRDRGLTRDARGAH
jgi:formate-dependent nitrite reductase cytochrome c552 subunit